MVNIEEFLTRSAGEALAALYGEKAQGAPIQIQKTRKEFQGDYTLVVFPLLKASGTGPEQTAQAIGQWMQGNAQQVSGFNVVKGFLNLSLSDEFWAGRLAEIRQAEGFGQLPATGKTVMVEYSSPNTNKPLHLGHIRNNLLGYSVAEILKACGHKVIKANLVNDRGIHICKSMIAWLRYGNGETPRSSGMKGDHLVGKYYVEFDKHYKAEIKELTAAGSSEEEAKKNAPIILAAQDMLRKWESKDPEVYGLWEKMNGWVYEGFDATYKAMGVDFDKMYYESQTYMLGKELVGQGLEKGVFKKDPDGSVWIDLTADGLDRKLLLRSDGTSVYMTQDLGTAYERFREFSLDDLVYVVGNEQNYHFQVLKLILSKLGYAWADHITHLSYGMVELPEGRMKSREGTVVDADDLMEEMVATARQMSEELGKVDAADAAEAEKVGRMVGMGALKYFILKVDPKKTMLFDPKESIDFNGNTGPFIQYTHARIRSVMRKAAEAGYKAEVAAGTPLLEEERRLISQINDLPAAIGAAGENFSPALLANYAYELAKTFNGYYHDHSILHEADPAVRSMRLALAERCAATIARAMGLLGIDVPEKM